MLSSNRIYSSLIGRSHVCFSNGLESSTIRSMMELIEKKTIISQIVVSNLVGLIDEIYAITYN